LQGRSQRFESPRLHADSLSVEALMAKSDDIVERAHHGQIDKIGHCRVA